MLLTLLLLALFLPLLFIFLFFKVVTISFVKLGVPPWAVLLLFVLCLIGSLVNIPVWYESPSTPEAFFFYPHFTSGKIIAINLGGCVIPSLLALWLLFKAPLLKTLIATAAITGICYLIAEPVPGVGIQMPFFVAPLASAILALILTRGKGSWGLRPSTGRGAAPIAYISGVFGTLIGADLLHLSALGTSGIYMISIGGAGVFDGIFLTGIVAAFLA